jgi:hypothetical protein
MHRHTHPHTAIVEISCVQERLAIDKGAGQARVARSIGRFDHGHSKRRSHSRIPSSNRAINRREEEYRWLGRGQ